MKPFVNKKYKLEKFPEKGGWTFVRIPEVLPDKSKPFGWVRVRGTIDGYEIKKYNLMPMGNGMLFLAVKAEIRKQLKKKEGDTIHVILFPDHEPMQVPDEMMLCIKDEPEALKFFKSPTDSEQKYYIDWIYSARKDETKIERMAETVNRLLKGLKRYHTK